jgi:hypothetical protein
MEIWAKVLDVPPSQLQAQAGDPPRFPSRVKAVAGPRPVMSHSGVGYRHLFEPIVVRG